MVSALGPGSPSAVYFCMYIRMASLMALLATGSCYTQLQGIPSNIMYRSVECLLTGHDQELFSTFVRVLLGQQPCSTQRLRQGFFPRVDRMPDAHSITPHSKTVVSQDIRSTTELHVFL